MAHQMLQRIDHCLQLGELVLELADALVRDSSDATCGVEDHSAPRQVFSQMLDAAWLGTKLNNNLRAFKT